MGVATSLANKIENILLLAHNVARCVWLLLLFFSWLCSFVACMIVASLSVVWVYRSAVSLPLLFFISADTYDWMSMKNRILFNQNLSVRTHERSFSFCVNGCYTNASVIVCALECVWFSAENYHGQICFPIPMLCHCPFCDSRAL